MLLTVSFGKSDAEASKPLTPTEWADFAVWLNNGRLTPGDLLKCDVVEALQGWEHPKVTARRVQALLNRGAALGFALEKWARAGLWVVTRSDSDYPSRLKQRLRHKAPAILFGCGNRERLTANGIAVVGSRHARDIDIDFAASAGRRAAEYGKLVVSGGAAGVDQAAMFGALLAEGTAVGVLGNDLLRAASSTKYRRHLMSGDLALISPFNPEARFRVGNAMARNKYIYCLAYDAIVVCSTPDGGGTWGGAVENLRNEWVPVAVKRTESANSGNPRLVELGGRWLEGLDDPVFGTRLDVIEPGQNPNQRHDAVTQTSGAQQAKATGSVDPLLDSPQELSPVTEQTGNTIAGEGCAEASVAPAEDLYRKVQSLVSLLCAEPKQAKAIADALGVTKPTADAWINRLVQQSVLERLSKPVRYVTREKDLLSLAQRRELR